MTDQISETRGNIERYDTAITQTQSFVKQQRMLRKLDIENVKKYQKSARAIEALIVDADEAITHYRKQRRGEAERLLALESKE